MLGGILAFLPRRGKLLCMGKRWWGHGVPGRMEAREGCRAGGQRKGCFYRRTGATVWSDWWPYKWPWHRAEETQGEDEVNYSSSVDAFDFSAVEPNGLWGWLTSWGKVRILRKLGGAGDEQFSGWGTILRLRWDGVCGVWKGSGHNLLYLWTLIMFHAKTRPISREFTWTQGQAKWDKQ